METNPSGRDQENKRRKGLSQPEEDKSGGENGPIDAADGLLALVSWETLFSTVSWCAPNMWQLREMVHGKWSWCLRALLN